MLHLLFKSPTLENFPPSFRISSLFLVITTSNPLSSKTSLRHLEMARFTSFSFVPLTPTFPGSSPPCPGSITTTLPFLVLTFLFSFSISTVATLSMLQAIIVIDTRRTTDITILIFILFLSINIPIFFLQYMNF